MDRSRFVLPLVLACAVCMETASARQACDLLVALPDAGGRIACRPSCLADLREERVPGGRRGGRPRRPCAGHVARQAGGSPYPRDRGEQGLHGIDIQDGYTCLCACHAVDGGGIRHPASGICRVSLPSGADDPSNWPVPWPVRSASPARPGARRTTFVPGPVSSRSRTTWTSERQGASAQRWTATAAAVPLSADLSAEGVAPKFETLSDAGEALRHEEGSPRRPRPPSSASRAGRRR